MKGQVVIYFPLPQPQKLPYRGAPHNSIVTFDKNQQMIKAL